MGIEKKYQDQVEGQAHGRNESDNLERATPNEDQSDIGAPVPVPGGPRLWKGMCQHCGREAVFLGRYRHPESEEQVLLCTLCGQAMTARGWELAAVGQ
jgi:GAF domain-containing protein